MSDLPPPPSASSSPSASASAAPAGPETTALRSLSSNTSGMAKLNRSRSKSVNTIRKELEGYHFKTAAEAGVKVKLLPDLYNDSLELIAALRHRLKEEIVKRRTAVHDRDIKITLLKGDLEASQMSVALKAEAREKEIEMMKSQIAEFQKRHDAKRKTIADLQARLNRYDEEATKKAEETLELITSHAKACDEVRVQLTTATARVRELEEKLEPTEQALKRANTQLAYLEADVERYRAADLKYALDLQKASTQNDRHEVTISDLTIRNETLIKANEELNDAITKLKASEQQLQYKVRQLEKENAELQSDLNKEVDSNIAFSSKARDATIVADCAMKENARLNAKLDAAVDLEFDLRSQISDKVKQIAELELDNQKLDRKLKEAVQQTETAAQNTQAHQSQQAANLKKLAAINAELQSKLKGGEALNKELQSNCLLLETKINEERAQVDATNATLQAKEQELAALVNSQAAKDTELEAIKSALTSAKRDLATTLELKSEADQRLETLDADMKLLKDQIQVLTTERDAALAEKSQLGGFLQQKDGESAAELQRLTDELSEMKSQHQRQLQAKTNELAQLAEAKSQLETRAVAAEKAKAELQSKSQVLDAQVTFQKSRANSIQTDLDTAQSQLQQKEAELQKLAQANSELQEKLSGLEKLQQDFDARATEIQQTLARLETAEKQLADSQEEVSRLQTEVEAHASKTAGLEKEIQEAKLGQANSQAHAAELSEKKAQLEEAIRVVHAELADEKHRANTLQSTLAAVSQDREDKSATVQATQAKLEAAEQRELVAQTTISQLEEAVRTTQAEVERLHATFSGTEAELIAKATAALARAEAAERRELETRVSLSRAQTELASKASAASLISELEQKKIMLDEANHRCNELAQKLADVEKGHEEAQGEIKRQKEQLDKSAQENARLAGITTEKETELKALQSSVAQLQQQLQGTNALLESERNSMLAQIQIAHAQLTDAQKERDQLKEKLTTASSSSSSTSTSTLAICDNVQADDRIASLLSSMESLKEDVAALRKDYHNGAHPARCHQNECPCKVRKCNETRDLLETSLMEISREIDRIGAPASVPAGPSSSSSSSSASAPSNTQTESPTFTVGPTAASAVATNVFAKPKTPTPAITPIKGAAVFATPASLGLSFSSRRSGRMIPRPSPPPPPPPYIPESPLRAIAIIPSSSSSQSVGISGVNGAGGPAPMVEDSITQPAAAPAPASEPAPANVQPSDTEGAGIAGAKRAFKGEPKGRGRKRKAAEAVIEPIGQVSDDADVEESNEMPSASTPTNRPLYEMLGAFSGGKNKKEQRPDRELYRQPRQLRPRANRPKY